MSKTSKGAIKETSKFAKVFIYLMLAFLAIIIIVPVAWVFMASIKENSEFYRSPWRFRKGFISRTSWMPGRRQTWVLSC